MRYLRLMRPGHWSKNAFVFAAAIFGKKLFGSADEVLLAVGSSVGAFFCFCMAASAIYIFNDIIDREADRQHREKCSRPIAAGEVGVGSALVVSIICAIAGVVGGWMLADSLAIIIIMYVVLMIFYTLIFKKVMILDCLVISLGFCLRAIAGAAVVGVFISPWLIICTFALCLFLGFSKRRSEIGQLGEQGVLFRKTLAGYTPELLGHMVDVTSGLAIVCFLIYSMDDRTATIFGSNDFVYTTPLVMYCIFRFSALIQKGKFTGPVQLILRDHSFQAGLVLWVLSCVGIIYANSLGISFGSIWAY